MNEYVQYLLIDGYNILFAWEDLKEIAENSSLEDSRKKFIDIIVNYGGMVSFKIIVVFDAHLVKGNKGSVENIGDISIVYTKEAETADSYIERTTTILRKNYKVMVATSDRLEQIIIMGKGAIRISATELKQEINLVNKDIKDKIHSIKPIKYNTLFDNLGPEMAELFEKMRRN